MRLKSLTIGLGMAAAVTLAQSAAAQGRWELLGSRTVGFGVDRDMVSGRGQGRFAVIRLCVTGNAVHFRRVLVEFANGERQELPVDSHLRPGQCSANLELGGRARRIANVRLRYNSLPNFGGQAVVSVYGLQLMRGDGPGDGPGDGGMPQGAWDNLGTRIVGFQVDRDSFRLEGEGRFRALRFCVARNAVQFREVEVHYGNGERQELAVRRLIGPGQCTRPFDLDGRARRLRRVVMIYNAVPNFAGQAAVTLFGMR